MNSNLGEIILYQSEDGHTSIDVHLKDETVWLTLNQMTELLDRDKSVISHHLGNIFQTVSWQEKQWLQKMQQLPRTVKHTRSITITWMP